MFVLVGVNINMFIVIAINAISHDSWNTIQERDDVVQEKINNYLTVSMYMPVLI